MEFPVKNQEKLLIDNIQESELDQLLSDCKNANDNGIKAETAQ